MSGSADSTDYSSFEYQQLTARLGFPQASGSQETELTETVQFDVLGTIGGLANNEVAELVGYRLTVSVDGSDSSADGDQNVGGTHHFEVALAANGDNEAVPTNYPGADDVQLVSPGASVSSATVSRDEVFELAQGGFSLPFDDIANGLGGGGFTTLYSESRNMRQLTGRGPVLDQSDDLTVTIHNNSSDNVISPETVVHVHLIWDVAETDDAGRAFSVPSGV